MATSLDSLRDCCQALVSDKLKERRDSADKLRDLLSNDVLCQRLHDAAAHGDGFSWRQMLQSAVTFFQKELTKVEADARAGRNVAVGTAPAHRAVSLLALVAEKANRGRVRLDVDELADVLTTALRHPFRRDAASAGLCSLVQRALLRSAAVHCELKLSSWRELISVACLLLRDPPARLGGWAPLSLLADVSELGCRQTALVSSVEALLPLVASHGVPRPEPGHLQLAPATAVAALRLTNAVCVLAAPAARSAVCALGDQLFTPLLRLNDSRQQADLLQWLQLLLCARTPRCERAEYAAGPPDWQAQLRLMYQLVMDEADARSSEIRQFRSTGGRLFLSPRLLRLFSWVAHLLFEADEQLLDVTQLASCTAVAAAEPRPAKRRRLAVGVQPLCERCHRLRDSLEAVPWLQLLRALLQWRPQQLSAPQLQCAVQLLVTWLSADSRRPELVREQLQLAVALLRCPAAYSCAVEWRRLGQLAMKTSSLVLCQQAAHSLLQDLLRRRLLRPDHALLQLYAQQETPVSRPLLLTLLALLRHHPMPTPTDPTQDTLEPRRRLIRWLLTSGDAPAVEVAEACTRLVLRDTTAHLSVLPEPPQSPPTLPDTVTELGELYCRTELITPLVEEKTGEVKSGGTEELTGAAAVSPLRREVLAALDEQLSDVVGSEDAGAEQWCVRAADLSTRVLVLLRVWCGCGLVQHQELHSLSTGQCLSTLASRLLSAASHHVCVTPDQSTAKLRSIIAALETLFSSVAAERAISNGAEQTEPGRCALARLLMSSTPADFTTACLTLLEDRSGLLIPRAQRVGGQLADDDDDILDASEPVEEADTAGVASVLTTRLHELEQVRLGVCKLLTSLTAGDLSTGWEGETDLSAVLTEVLQCLLEHRLNVQHPGDLQIALHLLRSVPGSPALVASHLPDMSRLLLCVCRQWRRDASVNQAVLQAMGAGYLQRAADTGSAPDRTDAMKFVQAMQMKLERARYGERCLLAHLRLLALLAELDPAGRWAVVDGEWAAMPLLLHLSAPPQPSRQFPAAGWSSHRSRMLAADLLQRVFAARERTPDTDGAAPSLQQMFDEVNTAALQCLAPPEASASAQPQQEDPGNRPAALCTALARVALVSVACRPRALFALCRAAREPSMPVSAVLQTFRLLAKALGRQGPRALLIPHLCSLLREWVSAALPLLEFPYQLMEYGSAAEFAAAHLTSTVPPLLARSEAALTELAAALGRSPEDLIVTSLPQLVAAALAAPVNEALLNMARRLAGGTAVFDRELTSRAAELVTAVLRTHGADSDRLPDYLRYLADSLFQCSLVTALQRPTGDGIQLVLLNLATDAATAADEARIQSARAYCALVDVLSQQFADLGPAQGFVMYDVPACVSHRLAVVTLPGDASLACVYAEALTRLCRACANCAPELMLDRLELFCATLVSLWEAAEAGSELRGRVHDALSQLIHELAEFGHEGLSAATCLPASMGLRIVPSVYSPMDKLVAADRLTPHALETALSSVEEADTPPSCPPYMLSRLLRAAADSSSDARLRWAAARLLGALGVQPLTTATVREQPESWQCCGAVGSDQTRNVHMLFTVRNLLVDPDPAVVAAAGVALRAALAEPGSTGARDLLHSQEPFLTDQLLPFHATRQRPARGRTISRAEALQKLDSAGLWVPETVGYQAWLCDLTVAALEVGAQVSPELAAYVPLCRLKGATFCRLVLPYATKAALLSDQQLRGVLGGRMSKLLGSCAPAGSDSSTAQGDVSGSQVELCCAEAVLDVLLYLRRQPLPDSWGVLDSAWQRHFWLELSLPAAASAALACGLHCEAILLSEVCCYSAGRDDLAQLLPASAEGDQLRWLLREAHARLGDSDGVAALRGAGDDAAFQEQHGDWLAALSGYDWQTGGGQQAAAQAGLLRCLAQLQLFGCSAVQLRGLTAHLPTGEPVPPHLTEAACEAAWRLSDWSLSVQSSSDREAPPGVQRTLYNCLSAVRDGDTAAALRAVADGRAAALAPLATAAPPSSHAASFCLSRLRLMREAELLCSSDGDTLFQLCDRWRAEPYGYKDGAAGGTRFALLEPTLAFRAALLGILEQRRPQLTVATQARRAALLQLSELARAAGHLPAAERAVRLLTSDSSHNVSRPGSSDLAVGKCVAELWWARGDAPRALMQCRSLLEPASGTAGAGDGIETLLRAQLRVRYASWLSEEHAETPRDILEQQLTPAIQQLETMSQDAGAQRALVEAHLMAGRYADAQFQRVDQLVSSAAFADKRQEAARMRQEAAQFRRKAAAAASKPIVCKDMRRQEMHLTRTAELDEAELSRHETERADFQRQAVTSYLRCLQLSDRRQLLMYRLVALWLADDSGKVCQLLEPAVPSLASHQFISLLQQLAARLGRPGWDRESAALLESVLLRCAEEHPHHTLPVLLALRHSREDPAVAGQVPDAAAEKRTAAAGRLLDQLRARPLLADSVSQLEKASRELIILAYQQTKPGATSGQMTGTSGALCRQGAAPAVAVQTVPIAVRPDADYSAAPTVVRWDRTYEMVGGVNAPKKLRCLGSDGRWRPQLLKGHDDLRQDAVMQQVFCVLNQLLSQNAAADQQPLAIRCYRVVPLSQRSGLIEWCVDTQPLGDYLTGSGGAHARYRPNDMPIRDARRAMTDVAKKSVDRRRKAFADVCARMQPVFRHFFWERFPEPSEWYERRVAYTNSVAAASISGYVLGLGDRHVSNILIDLATAEVIHIDLGVAFETGRLLPTPETVPFRLTRDLVDGMGVSGVRGRFERSCQRTLTVLRDSSEVIMTIVRVLLEDPLYAWTLTAEKASRIQERSVPERQDNRQAERALSRLAEKLRGQEHGQVMSCAAQVSHLIQQARDPDNLSMLFAGWQAYL